METTSTRIIKGRSNWLSLKTNTPWEAMTNTPVCFNWQKEVNGTAVLLLRERPFSAAGGQSTASHSQTVWVVFCQVRWQNNDCLFHWQATFVLSSHFCCWRTKTGWTKKPRSELLQVHNKWDLTFNHFWNHFCPTRWQNLWEVDGCFEVKWVVTVILFVVMTSNFHYISVNWRRQGDMQFHKQLECLTCVSQRE